ETNTGFFVSPEDTGTDPLDPDTDDDGLLDGVETNTSVFVDPDDTGTNPHLPDTDADGVRDDVEVRDYGSDPNDPDTDDDGAIDGQDNCVLVTNGDQANADPGDDDSSRPGIQRYGNRCDSDLDNNGFVNTADFFGFFRPCFGVLILNAPQCAASDFDGSGVVNVSDFFGFFRPGFFAPPGPGISNP
ncbi:MAG: hypothetical protein VX614_03630, partial [Myxococcota bacterium]|nr:hypothetical protein [Myxococcota bacterium]